MTHEEDIVETLQRLTDQALRGEIKALAAVVVKENHTVTSWSSPGGLLEVVYTGISILQSRMLRSLINDEQTRTGPLNG